MFAYVANMLVRSTKAALDLKILCESSSTAKLQFDDALQDGSGSGSG